MKTIHISKLLAAILLTAALINFPSCKKEPLQPGQQQNQGNNNTGSGTERPELAYANAEGLVAYPGEPVTVDFTITGDTDCTVSFQSDANSSVKGSYDPATGRGTVVVTLNDKVGRGVSKAGVTVEKDKRKEYHYFEVAAYYLEVSAEDIVFSANKGDARSINGIIETNIEGFVPKVSVDADWLSYADGTLATTSDNATGAVRTGTVVIGDPAGHFNATAVKVMQAVIEPENSVHFDDPAFRAAMVAIADRDGDGFVSYDEALQVTEVTAVGKGITDLSGLEHFKNIERLDLRDNDIKRLWLDDPASYSRLKYIDVRNNPKLQREVNVQGCFAGYSITFLHSIANGPLFADITTVADYSSTDYSYDGLKRLITHSVGDGIALNFLMTDYVDLDYANGAVDDLIRHEMDDLFSIEPFKSMRAYFDVNIFAIVAPGTKEKASKDSRSDWAELMKQYNELNDVLYDPLNGYPAQPFNISIDYNGDGNYAFPLYPGMSTNNHVVLCGRRRVIDNPLKTFTFAHELGHAIGGLCDEYIGSTSYLEAPNYTENLSKLPWERFLEIPKYASRIKTTPLGAGYIPSESSIMNAYTSFTINEFNSPSRYALYRNIIYLSERFSRYQQKYPDPWEEFLEYDVVNDGLPI